MDYRGFVGPSYESQAYTADAEDTVNLYTERMESPGATTRWCLYPTPGVTQIGSAGNGVGRAHEVAAGREFAVKGITLYEIDSNGGETARGTVAIGADPATISYNGDGGDQLFVTSGGNGYIFNMTTLAFTQVAALNGKASMGAHLDGYFLALDANTSTLYISNLLAGLTWSTGTDFAQRSQASDPWIALRVNGKYVWLFGTETSEVWYDTGGSFPFAPYPSGLVPYGIAAAYSTAQVGAALVWLGASASGGYYVLQANGFTAEVISTIPHQLAMSRYSVVSDAIADSYNEIGHTFYVLTFPTADVTWAWDAATGHWARRGTWMQSTGTFVAWRPGFHAWAFGEHRMLDHKTTSVYRLSSAITTDVDSTDIRRVRRAPCLEGEDQRIFYSSFQLDLESGLGIEIGSYSSVIPTNNNQTSSQIMLRMSNDGGKNWGAELWKPMGKLGAYGFRAIWHRLGCGRRRVFEVAFSSPVQWRITGAYLALGQQPQQRGAPAQVGA